MFYCMEIYRCLFDLFGFFLFMIIMVIKKLGLGYFFRVFKLEIIDVRKRC